MERRIAGSMSAPPKEKKTDRTAPSGASREQWNYWADTMGRSAGWCVTTTTPTVGGEDGGAGNSGEEHDAAFESCHSEARWGIDGSSTNDLSRGRRICSWGGGGAACGVVRAVRVVPSGGGGKSQRRSVWKER
jgi:hypothetical protein